MQRLEGVEFACLQLQDAGDQLFEVSDQWIIGSLNRCHCALPAGCLSRLLTERRGLQVPLWFSVNVLAINFHRIAIGHQNMVGIGGQ